MAITSCVHVWVKPACLKEFMEASFENQQHSSKEKGNIRFDVCQDPTNPCKFLLYEAYLDESSAIAHKETAHYLKWRNTVASFMKQPRKAEKYNILVY
jgi:autoinducer 2-degrading protein